MLFRSVAAVPIVSWRNQRAGVPTDDEDQRLAAFMAETLAAAASKKPAPQAAARPSFEQMRSRAAQLDEGEMFEAFAAARLALIENGRDAQSAAVAALLARRLAPGESQAALRRGVAAQAIGLCLAAGQAGDVVGAQKRLIEVAGKAGQAGQAEVALKLYRTLLGKYPDSTYAQFARDNMKLEQRRLVTNRDKVGRG